MGGATHLYAIGIGSNRRHGRYGRPAGVVEAAIARLDADFGLFDASPIVLNPAIGRSGREFANAVALIESKLDPPALLKDLKAIEREFGAHVAGRDADDGGAARRQLLGQGVGQPQTKHRGQVVEQLAAIVETDTLGDFDHQ